MTPPAADADGALIADLRQRFDDALRSALDGARNVALVNFPNHGNPGDSAIWLGARAALRRLGVRVRYRCAWCTYSPAALRDAHPSGPVLINGGGNFGDLYAGQQGLRERLLGELRDRRLIQLPQSIHFREPENLERVRALVDAHGAVTLMLRDRASYEFARERFTAPALLAPDCAFGLGRLRAPARTSPPGADVLWLHRLQGDPEYVDHGTLSGPLRVSEVEWLRRTDPEPPWPARAGVARRVNAALLWRCRGEERWARRAWRPLAATFDPLGTGHVRRGLSILGRGRVLVTDKLHGHVMAVLAGIEHVVLDNSYGKVSGTYQAWTRPSRLAHWAEDADEAMAVAEGLLAGAPPHAGGA